MFRSAKGNDKKLLEKIEDQEQKILRYESRLRDVVQAYKSLQKEKEALESTVKALSSTPTKDGNRKQRSIGDTPKKYSQDHDRTEASLEELQGRDNESSSDQESTQKDDMNEELDQLHEKISTLSKALATVTEEKSKMAAAFQADKKLAIQEHEKRLRESEEQMEFLEAKNNDLESQIDELKSRLKQHHLELQAEQDNNSIMLKEMQQILSAERLEKEELKIRLQERREADKSESSKKAYEVKIQELSDELASVSSKLQQFETDASQPSSLLLQISDEMLDLKKYHLEALRKEQVRANEAEEALKRFSSMEEERIGQLETKLTELSDIVSSYEKMRYQDQLVIQKLKEKLSQIDSTISPTTNQQLNPLYDEFSSSNQITDLKEQVLKLKGLLRLTWNNKTSEQPVEAPPITVAELDNILHNDPAHRACQLEYKQLKNEFENYKKDDKKSNSKSQKTLSSESQELTISKQKLVKLENELNHLRICFEEKERDYIETISNLQCDVTSMEERNSSEIERLKETCKLDILLLESQLAKQRERTLQLISDKDEEISRLRADPLSSPLGRKTFESNDALQTSMAMPGDTEAKRSFETETAVRQLLTRQNSAGTDGSMVYYMQQISYYQTEITELRNKNSELESLLRDEEHREEQFVEQLNTLKQEIRRLERNRSRENANLEYIKNIVLKYILSDSYSVRQQLTTTLATVLQFSPSEVNEIRKKQSAWWPNQ